MYLIGLDIGTQGAKGILVDLEGKIINEAYREYDVLTPKSNWAEQWPDVWLKASLEIIKELIEKSNVNKAEIGGISLSGLYGGSGIPVDKNLNPLRPCLIWMDRRAVEETEWVKNKVDKQTLFKITGNYVDSYYGFTKMLWIKNKEPDIWKRIYKFVTPKDYVIYHLTGKVVIDYSSAGNIGGIFDLNKLYWSEELCNEFGIPISYLPEKIVRSSEIVGFVSREASQNCGLLEGTPVVAGGIDAPVAQLSAGAMFEGEHVAMVGTSMCWGTINKKEKPVFGLVNFPYVIDDLEKIYTFGGSATTGALAKWFKEEFGEVETLVGKRLSKSPYEIFDDEVSKIKPGSEGLVILPYFMGERSPIWDPYARGLIFGLSLYHKREHIYRALMEAGAYALRHNIEEGKKAGLKINEECYLVGGVAKSSVWTKIFADVTGYKMKRVSNQVEAPYGDAFLAALGVGVINSPTKIKEWVKYSEPIVPDFGVKEIYDRYYEIYIELYQKNKELFKKL
ncbi:FGGY-family carbohydrate kinase [Thermosipho atlanticus]|uniref:Xylulokinase n=1 Tax=Thermosipho atlanticus DSM 15807 TaxID=1123380 RepID=A0A1M5TUY1_9BACT|nr:FGGY-family carbohydrate kinase [Thermosipho atlanticus]SHH54587.1 xylulokinase [Thermosipho atlanticus DSM 15807]